MTRRIRPWIIVRRMNWIGRSSLLTASGAAVALGLTYRLADGADATHARGHLAAAALAALAAALVAYYRHTREPARLVVRAAIALGFVYVAGTQLGEGISAFGYDRLDAHGLFDSMATTALLGLGAALVAWPLVVLWQRGTRPAVATR
jgi:hypothetical protein